MTISTRRDVLVGIAFMVLAVSLLPAMNAMAKHLALHYPISQVVWARFLGHLAWMVALFGPALGFSLFRTAHPRAQWTRAVIFFVSNVAFISALPHVALATASTIMFTTPLIVVLLSVPLLGETVGAVRLGAALLGFAGAVVVVGPGAVDFEPGSLLVLLSAICFACYQIVTRRLAGRERPEILIVYTSAAGALVMSLVAPWSAVWPRAALDWVWFAGIGLVGGLAQFCIIKALERAPASIISPIGYTELVSAVFFGFIIFDTLPEARTWVGAGVIIAAGLILIYREGVRGDRPRAASR